MGRPSRLVLGKKFFWIWFIYALEGIVLASQFFFFDKVSHLKHPSGHLELLGRNFSDSVFLVLEVFGEQLVEGFGY